MSDDGNRVIAEDGDKVSIHYTGWLHDPKSADKKGKQFDSSRAPKRGPLPFTLGAGQVITGWDNAIRGMAVGETKTRLVIEPNDAYGTERKGKIPPNSRLIFDIEVTEVTKGKK